MTRTLVLSNPPHALRIDSPQCHRVERLPPESLHDLVVEPVVLTVKAALKFGTRPPLEIQPAWRLARHLGHERRPLVDWLRAEAHPEEVLDHVGFDQGSVDVEHSQHITPAGAPLQGRANRARLRLGRGASARLATFSRNRLSARHADHGRKVDVLEVMLPVVQRGIERELLALGRRYPLPHGHEVPRVEDAVNLRVHAVKLNQVEAPLEPLTFTVEVVGKVCDARTQRQPLHRPLRGTDELQSSLPFRRQLAPRRISPCRCADSLPVSIAQRMLREEACRLFGHHPKAERVAAA